MKLIGPFVEVIGLQDVPASGAANDDALTRYARAGILVDGGLIKAIGDFDQLAKENPKAERDHLSDEAVALPGFIDAHTHICFAGSRARDYSLRVAGKTYQEILKQGGGIHETVAHTRAATEQQLSAGVIERCQHLLRLGVTTCEVKSGYGLSVSEELKMLRAIAHADANQPIDLVASCLAAHVVPKEFDSAAAYLQTILNELLPVVANEKLAKRVDAFVEDGAFAVADAKPYLQAAQKLGFDVVVHADQFSTGGAKLACELGARSADHLEVSTPDVFKILAQSNVAAVVLPGSSLGLGEPFAPARELLDAGCSVVIASDWNPGSAPMGDLLLQASVLGAAQKLTIAESLAGITSRAAKALGLNDRGSMAVGERADLAVFNCADVREVFYAQGRLRPDRVYSQGELVLEAHE